MSGEFEEGLPQNRLNVLMAIYNRRITDVAVAARMSRPTASQLVNCSRRATPEQIARLEAAIVDAGRLIPHMGLSRPVCGDVMTTALSAD